MYCNPLARTYLYYLKIQSHLCVFICGCIVTSASSEIMCYLEKMLTDIVHHIILLLYHMYMYPEYKNKYIIIIIITFFHIC